MPSSLLTSLVVSKKNGGYKEPISEIHKRVNQYAEKKMTRGTSRKKTAEKRDHLSSSMPAGTITSINTIMQSDLGQDSGGKSRGKSGRKKSMKKRDPSAKKPELNRTMTTTSKSKGKSITKKNGSGIITSNGNKEITIAPASTSKSLSKSKTMRADLQSKNKNISNRRPKGKKIDSTKNSLNLTESYDGFDPFPTARKNAEILTLQKSIEDLPAPASHTPNPPDLRHHPPDLTIPPLKPFPSPPSNEDPPSSISKPSPSAQRHPPHPNPHTNPNPNPLRTTSRNSSPTKISPKKRLPRPNHSLKSPSLTHTLNTSQPFPPTENTEEYIPDYYQDPYPRSNRNVKEFFIDGEIYEGVWDPEEGESALLEGKIGQGHIIELPKMDSWAAWGEGWGAKGRWGIRWAGGRQEGRESYGLDFDHF